MSGFRPWFASMADALYAMLDQAGYAFGMVASGLLLARWLGVEAFGVATLVTIATTVAAVGCSALILEPALSLAQRNAAAIGGYVRATLILGVGLSLLLGLASALFFTFVAPPEFGGEPEVMLLVFGAGASLTLALTVRRLAIAARRGAVAASVSLGGAVGIVGGVVWLEMQDALSVQNWIALQAVVNLAFALPGAALLARGPGDADLREVARSHLAHARFYTGAFAMQFAAVQGPMLVIESVSGVASLGAFRALFNLTQPFTLFVVALTNAFTPPVSKRLADGAQPGVGPLPLAAVATTTASVIIVGGTAVLWEIPLLKAVYGPDFVPPPYAFATMIVACALTTLGVGYDIVLRAAGRIGSIFVASTFSALVALATALAAASAYGAAAGAYAMLGERVAALGVKALATRRALRQLDCEEDGA